MAPPSTVCFALALFKSYATSRLAFSGWHMHDTLYGGWQATCAFALRSTTQFVALTARITVIHACCAALVPNLITSDYASTKVRYGLLNDVYEQPCPSIFTVPQA